MSHEQRGLWVRRIADEFWTGAVTPLTFSLLGRTMEDRMVRRSLRLAGLASVAERPVLRLYGSHVYVNGALLAEVIRLLPASLQSAGLLALLPEELHGSARGGSFARAAPRALAIACRLALREPRWAPWQRAAAFDAACARVRERFEPGAPIPADLPMHALTTEITRVRASLGDFLEVVSWGIVFAYVFFHLMIELARRWAHELAAERAALTVGLPGVASLQAHDELVALGRLLEPQHRTLVEASGPGAALTQLQSEGGPVQEAFQTFLSRHGHRLTGRDLLCPTWREAPETVLALAVRETSATGERESSEARRLSATAAIERAIGGGFAGPARRLVFRTVLTTAQRYYVVRENMRYHADFVLARLRALVVALGERLVAAGRITDPLDLFFLTFEEIEATVDGQQNLTARIADRRATFAHDQRTAPPTIIREGVSDLAHGAARVDGKDSHGAGEIADEGSRGEAEVAGEGSRGEAAGGGERARTLSGEPAAPGHCRGRACIVRGPEDFDRVSRGDVLVATYTDPGWTTLLELASGLVLEGGGQLSHGAIVARELGIPALVNVPDATRRIRSGDLLELDAGPGVVTIVAVSAPDQPRSTTS